MKNKQIDLISNIMSKRHNIFAKNFIISFSNAEKTGRKSAFKFDIF